MFSLSARICATCLLFVFSYQVMATVVMKPTPLAKGSYPSLLTAKYNPNISKPKQVLGFEVGQQTATPEQINQLVNLWAQQSEKVRLVEYARTYEGRPLHYMVISSADNINNLASIKQNINTLAYPDSLSKDERQQLIEQTPGTAWMAYSIHGNETSGADSALALIYHLIAADNTSTLTLLDDLLIIVDPMMNPDGRARFAKNLQENRGSAPNFDTQSALHTGVWPFGRTNHYLFDLNRDFYFAVNPESRGRINAINQWFPLLMIDGHEMGALDTFLFGPPREPVNEHIAKSIVHWGNVFADQQAKAFDQKQWPYYTGEWFENLYPGYSNYAEYKGAIHILYEQARTAEDGVKLANGNIRTYKESVDHQFVSSLSNLATLQQNKDKIYQDFVNNRLSHIAKKGPYANKSFVILPSENTSRLTKLLDLLTIQNIEYYMTSASMKVDDAKNHLGQVQDTTIAKGSIVIPNRQYEAPLIAAILEFDAKIKDSVLLEEHQKTLRDGSSVMYDNTAWNITMMYGLPAIEVDQHITDNLVKYTQPTTGEIDDMDNSIAYFVDGESDASVAFAARLLEQNVQVRVLDKVGEFNKTKFNRGTVVVYKYDNTMADSELKQLVQATAKATKTQVKAINQGLGYEDLPDIGGQHFKLLRRPKLGIITQNGTDPGDFGSMWHLIDTELGIRHSHLIKDMLNRTDLRKYNVIVVPSRWYGSLSTANLAMLGDWVEQGGTFIVNGNSAEQVASAKDFSKVSLLKETFEKASEYNTSLYREWLAQQSTIRNDSQVNSHKVAESVWFPWANSKELKPMKKEKLEQWNSWTKNFMPSGAMIASRTDQKHWLTFGVHEQLPVLTSDAPLFMVKDNAEAVVRYGVYVPNKKAKEKMVGWSTIPEGHDLYLRMSGLLWPEAGQRITNAAYLTRERKGKGQIILFADSPNFRGATKGTARLLLNAIVYGPGLGSKPPINL